MSPAHAHALDYPAVFAAIGKFVHNKKIHSVCLLEFEHGIIVTGTVMYESAESTGQHTETHIFSLDDLKKMVKGG